MQVQSKQKQSAHLINALQYCHCANPISANLLIALSERLKENPKLLAQQLIHRVEQTPSKNSDPLIRLNFLNTALTQTFQISKELKERIALKIGVSATSIYQKP